MKTFNRLALVGFAASLNPPPAFANTCSGDIFHLPHYELPPALSAAYVASNFPGPIHIFATVAGLQGGWTPGLKLYETPIAVRFTHLIDVMNWNCAAMYSPSWRDALTKEEPLLRAPPSIMNGLVDLHTSDTRLLCMVHAWAAVVHDWVPEAGPTLMGVTNSFGYVNVTGTFNGEVDACFDTDGPAGPEGAANQTCLSSVAANNCFSPQIMGAIVARQLTEYARHDGWNMYGTLNKDGTPCQTNCRRYTDPTGYAPVHGPLETNHAKKTRWKPLLEDNGRGYETRQEHVTPHIGLLGKAAILSTVDFEERVAPKPYYNYNVEALAVAERLAATAVSSEKKMSIEFFDDKIDVAFAVIGAVASLGTSFEQLLNYVVGLTASEYDATLVAWKEKRENDLVRPTTWIQDEMADADFVTYGGPYKGAMPIKGKNFESWVRVMPHSEYVSGSACICQAMYEFTDRWLELMLGVTDSVAVPLPTFPAGSSKTEPGMTPAQDLTLVMADMLDLRNTCGQSRLDGGMHFTVSVDNSYGLCQGIGPQGADFADDLMV